MRSFHFCVPPFSACKLVCLILKIFFCLYDCTFVPSSLSLIVNYKLRISVLGRLRNLQYILAVIYVTPSIRRVLFVCPSSDPFYIVNYYTKWVTTSWTDCMQRVTQKLPQITQPSQYGYANLQYRFEVTSGSPSILLCWTLLQ